MTQGRLDLDPPAQEGSTGRCDAHNPVFCARPGCDRPVPEHRGGSDRRYCGRDCQRRAWEEAHPRLESGRDALQRLPAKKLTRAERVLARLRQGPATGIQLLQSGGGLRYSARIHELRNEGHRIHGPVEVFAKSQTWVYPAELPVLEAIPKTADGHDLYELRED